MSAMDYEGVSMLPGEEYGASNAIEDPIAPFACQSLVERVAMAISEKYGHFHANRAQTHQHGSRRDITSRFEGSSKRRSTASTGNMTAKTFKDRESLYPFR